MHAQNDKISPDGKGKFLSLGILFAFPGLQKEAIMLRTVLLVFLVLMLVGLLPVWPYAHSLNWGYYPSGGLLVLLVALLVLMPGGDRSLL